MDTKKKKTDCFTIKGDQTIKINNVNVMALSENEEFKRAYQAWHAANRSIRKSLPQKPAKNPWKK